MNHLLALAGAGQRCRLEMIDQEAKARLTTYLAARSSSISPALPDGTLGHRARRISPLELADARASYTSQRLASCR